MTSNNVDNLINSVYADGYIRQNKYAIDMSYGGDFVTNIPAYAIRIPGWDISTVTESNVAGGRQFDRAGGASIKHFPYRKNWRQELFVTFFMEKKLDTFDFVNKWANSVAAPAGPRPFYESQVKGNYLRIKVGEYADSGAAGTEGSPDITFVFEEAFPRVVYPIELKPIEDVSPFIFSVQFNYRYFDIFDTNGGTVG